MLFITHPKRREKLSAQLYIRDYIHAGNGICTLENPSTHIHYQYRFGHPLGRKKFKRGTSFVAILDDRGLEHYVGKLEPDGKLHLTFRSLYPKDSPEFKGAKYICEWAHKPHFHSRMNLYHEGVCAYCGKPLGNLWEMKRGFHKTCYSVLFPDRVIKDNDEKEKDNG